MATTTGKLGLPRPEATDNVTLENEQALIDAIDHAAAAQADLDTHKGDNTAHVTAAERAGWNAKETPAGAQAKAEAATQAAKDYTDQRVGAIQLTAQNVSIADTGNRFTSTDVEGALSELFQNVSDGKVSVAAAVTAMGQVANGSMTFAQLAAAIQKISNDANATTSQVLAGQTFYQGGAKRTGTMPNRGNVNQTLTTQGQTYTVPQGYHGGSGTVVASMTNLTAANIKDGVSVGGVAGTYSKTTSPAAASQILSGRVAFANGSQVTGTMPNRGSVGTQTITTQNGEYTIPAGYHNGAGKVRATFANLSPQNIRQGTKIGGITGSLVEGKQFAVGSVSASWNGTVYTAVISGLAFTPKTVIISFRDSSTSSEYRGIWTNDTDMMGGIAFNSIIVGGQNRSSCTVDVGTWTISNGGITIQTKAYVSNSIYYIALN